MDCPSKQKLYVRAMYIDGDGRLQFFRVIAAKLLSSCGQLGVFKWSEACQDGGVSTFMTKWKEIKFRMDGKNNVASLGLMAKTRPKTFPEHFQAKKVISDFIL